jgi:hypothetical protein
MIPSGIEPATCRFVAQCLTHYATTPPTCYTVKGKGELEVIGRRGRRRKKLLDDLKDKRGYSHLKEEAVNRTMWRNRFGGGIGPVVRQNIE